MYFRLIPQLSYCNVTFKEQLMVEGYSGRSAGRAVLYWLLNIQFILILQRPTRSPEHRPLEFVHIS